MMRAILFLAVLAIGASCARGGGPAPPRVTPVVTPAPAAAPPAQTPPPPVRLETFDPEGEYTLEATFGGSNLVFTLELWRENGQWRGVAGNPNVGSADLSSLVQNGRSLRVVLVAPGGLSYILEFDVRADNSVVGTWSTNNDGSRITGRKTK